VAEREPEAHLWLSGPGDARPLLAAAPAAARERAEVLPLGEPSDQAERYARAWVTALPSTNESFGMVLLESLASGTPIAVSDHAAPKELVTPQTGVVCEAENPRSLADALVAAFDLARGPQTVERCRAYAAGYDWDESLAPRLERLYAEARTRA
jgi:glycosyltransferase involved in cell wall biosynthesis